MEICLTLNVIHTNMRESSNYHDVSERFIYIFLVVGPMGMISENRPKQWIDKDILYWFNDKKWVRLSSRFKTNLAI